MENKNTSSTEETKSTASSEPTKETIEIDEKRVSVTVGSGKVKTISALEERPCFELEPEIISFVMENPFFAHISRYIKKIPTRDIPTAAISYDKANDDLVLWWNDQYFKKLAKDGKEKVRGALTHEFYHFIFGHLTGRIRRPHNIANIATDCAINSLIENTNGLKTDKGWIVPRKKFSMDEIKDFDSWKEEEKEAFMKYSDCIKKFPHFQSSEYYFKYLKEVQQELNEKYGYNIEINFGPSGSGTFDDHDFWDSIPDDLRDMIETKIKNIIEKAARNADAQSNGWGNIPANIAEEIRRYAYSVIDWKALLRQFIGYSYVGERTPSMKKINKRYPYIHPGTKRKHYCRLAVAIDQSGSVDDQSLARVFAELGKLTKMVTITVIPFDCSVEKKDVFTWKRGTSPKLKRVKSGGTDFNAPTHFVNSKENKGKWDVLLIATDGECNKPEKSITRRGWIIVPDRKLNFETNEVVIKMSQSDSKITGAWR